MQEHRRRGCDDRASARRRLLSRERTLRERLAEYDPPLPAVLVPCGDDPIEIAGGAGARDLPPDVRDQVDRGR
mgnify:CR=1 FL=1